MNNLKTYEKFIQELTYEDFSIFLESEDYELEENDFYDINEGKETSITKTLKKKSKLSGIPLSILRKVFAKGMQAWNAGHRPGVTQHQWGIGRVNSFITGAGGARKSDNDLWQKAKKILAKKKNK